MRIGVPKEIKKNEHRVGMIPSVVQELVNCGHDVFVEHDAGVGVEMMDEDYLACGATILDNAAAVYAQSDMIIKVKEPQAEEYNLLREGQILFTYLHLAADKPLTEALVKSKCHAIAYETVTDYKGSLPLLTPMSSVAGRLSIQAGSHALEKHAGGRGILLGGVSGVPRARVLVIGGGVVGTNAIRIAIGMQAHVTVIDKSLDRLRQLNSIFGSTLQTIYATQSAIEQYALRSDLIIGAVLVPGGAAPKLISRAMLARMFRGAVMVDVAIDQGGCFETSRATTHSNPTFVVDGVVHYCVANMPGAVPRTATFALNNATMPFILAIANKGFEAALQEDRHLRHGLNVTKGMVTYEAVAKDLGFDYVPAEQAIQ